MKRKGDKIYVQWKTYDIPFNHWVNKRDILQMVQYFPKPYERSIGNVKADYSVMQKQQIKKKQQVLIRLIQQQSQIQLV